MELCGVTARAGKTTVVRKFNGESIDEICPTLGFNIKTMDFQVSVARDWLVV